jgi:hypothetical protein
MSKVITTFQFPYPLKHKVVENCRLKTRLAGVLTIEATIYRSNSHPELFKEYYVEVDRIEYNGTDIKPVLEVMDAVIISDIDDEAKRQVVKIFQPAAKEVAI